jgi:hypothetical protein
MLEEILEVVTAFVIVAIPLAKSMKLVSWNMILGT